MSQSEVQMSSEKTYSQEFVDQMYRERGKQLQPGIMQTIYVWITCFILDYLVYPELVAELWLCRVVFVGALIGITLTLKYKLVQFDNYFLTALVYVASSVTITVMIGIINDSGSPYVLGLIVNSIVMTLMAGLRNSEIVFYSILNIGLYLFVSLAFITTPFDKTMAIVLVVHFLFVWSFVYQQVLLLREIGYKAFKNAKKVEESGALIEAQNRDLAAQNKKVSDNQDMLIQLSKSASMGDMTLGIMHEIKNPINITSMALRYAKKLKVSQMTQAQYNEVIEDSIEGLKRIQQIAKDLNQFAFKESHSKYVPTKISHIIELAMNVSRSELHDITVDVKYSCPLVVSIAENQIVQVLVNLISNSRSAFAPQQDNKRITIDVTKQHKNCVITFTDNGSGVPDDFVKNLFQPYYTTKAKTEGTGLGLNISQMTVEAHSGSMEFLGNEPGASFQIKLPLTCYERSTNFE